MYLQKIELKTLERYRNSAVKNSKFAFTKTGILGGNDTFFLVCYILIY